jgi:TPR repeat protein
MAPASAIARGCELTDPKPRAQLYGDDSALMKTPVSELLVQAETGNAEAQNALGVIYGTGRGVKINAAESSKWYRRAADGGLAVAQANLAYMYLNGEGIPKDLGLAFQWAEKSAAQGHYRGQLFLGYMYGTGTGVVRNGAEAEKCYLLAAKQGNLDAQKTLSRMYERGDGVPMDTQKAILWLHRVRDGSLSGRTWREE